MQPSTCPNHWRAVLVLARAAPASECAICGPPGCWVQLTAARSNLALTIFQLQSLEGGFCSGILHPLSQRPLALNSTPGFCRLRSFPGTTLFFGTTTTFITTSRSAPQEKHKRLHKNLIALLVVHLISLWKSTTADRGVVRNKPQSSKIPRFGPACRLLSHSIYARACG